jgi:hypothetical protein
MCRTRITFLSVFAMCLLAGLVWVEPAAARPQNPDGRQPPPNPASWNRAWNVYERSDNGHLRRFCVWPTTPQGIPINGGGWPQYQNGLRDQRLCFSIPGGRIAGQDHADAINNSSLVPGLAPDPDNIPGTSQLYIESVFFDSSSGTYILDGVADLIFQMYGDDVSIFVPDLYGDTNGNGQMDSDDLLYSLVDLRQFLLNPPSFDPLQTYSVVNGRVAGLPGMKFSTTPFSFSSGSGWDDGTPFTGGGTELSLHEAVVPAAPSACVLCVALWSSGLLRRRRGACGPRGR